MKKYLGILRYSETLFGILQLLGLLAVIPVGIIVLSHHPDTPAWVYFLVFGVCGVIIVFTFLAEVVPHFKSGYRSWYLDNQQYIIDGKEKHD